MRFCDFQYPPKTVMIYAETPEEAKAQMQSEYAVGADAFGFGGELLRREYRNADDLKAIFDLFGDKPFFVTSYRTKCSEGYTDEACVDYLLLMQSLGATTCDVMGDLYCKDDREMTFDATAVEKQKALIERLHALGSEVIMSCHQTEFIDEATCVRYLQAQEARGADIVKLVNVSADEQQKAQNDAIVLRLKKTLNKPFLYLSRGATSMPLRIDGPKNGVCMYLCRATETGFQPTVKEVEAGNK